MTTITVWLLIVVAGGNGARGTTSVIDRFPSAVQCEHVRTAIPTEILSSRCVQAVVVR